MFRSLTIQVLRVESHRRLSFFFFNFLFFLNLLDFGDFRQIIFVFGLSAWTNIEYRIKISTVTFASLDKHYVYLSSLEKQNKFLSNIFICTPLMFIFGSKSQQSSRLFCTLCVNFVCNDILLMHTTYIPSSFNVLLNLKDLICKNMKISKYSQYYWVCSTSIFGGKNEYDDQLFY